MDVQISADRTYLTLITPQHKQRFHALWLRDNARDAATLSPSNGQRLITLLEQPPAPLLTQAVLHERDLRIEFEADENSYEYAID